MLFPHFFKDWKFFEAQDSQQAGPVWAGQNAHPRRYVPTCMYLFSCYEKELWLYARFSSWIRLWYELFLKVYMLCFSTSAVSVVICILILYSNRYIYGSESILNCVHICNCILLLFYNGNYTMVYVHVVYTLLQFLLVP